MSTPAESYEEYMVPAYFEPIAQQVVRVSRPRPGERVLDVACGTGLVARRIVPLVGPTGMVDGLDISPAMLDVAQRAAEREGQRISWHEGRAEALPFPDESFDLVVCQHGLQYVPDRAAATREMRRVLRPGGRAVLSVTQEIGQDPFEARFSALMEQHLGVSPMRQVFSLGDGSLFRAALEGGGLRDVLIDPVAFTAHYPDPERFLTMRIMAVLAAVPSFQQRTPEEGRAMIEELRQAGLPVVQEYVVGNEVVISAHVQIASGLR